MILDLVRVVQLPQLMVLHVLGFLTGWAWPILYILLIISGMGQENRKG